MSLNKQIQYKILCKLIEGKYTEDDFKTLLTLANKVIFDSPTKKCILNCKKSDWDLLPKEKSLFCKDELHGQPIGNLTSQLFANMVLDLMDKFIVGKIGESNYCRYADDFVFIVKDKKEGLSLLKQVKILLKEQLDLELHPNKIHIQHYNKGVKFIGSVIKPNRTYISNKTVYNFKKKLNLFIFLCNKNKNAFLSKLKYYESVINSYLGTLSQHNSYNIRKELMIMFLKSPCGKYFYVENKFSKIRILNKYSNRNKIETKINKLRSVSYISF